MPIQKQKFKIVQPLNQLTPNVSNESCIQISNGENVNPLCKLIQHSIDEMRCLIRQVNRQDKTLMAIQDNLNILQINDKRIICSFNDI